MHVFVYLFSRIVKEIFFTTIIFPALFLIVIESAWKNYPWNITIYKQWIIKRIHFLTQKDRALWLKSAERTAFFSSSDIITRIVHFLN